MRKEWVKLSGLLIAVVVIGLGMSGCGQQSKSATNKQLNVVTSTDFYGEAARAVLGNKGTVTSVINNPATDPHDYEPTPAVAKKVHQADVVVANGVGYDSWMTKLTADGDSSRVIRVGEDLMNKQNGDNPHLWYQPETMPKLVTALAAKYAKKQPQNKRYFEKNAKAYVKSRQPITREIAKIKQTVAHTGNRNVYVSEPVFDYALTAMGFKVANHEFEEAIENESDPSPKSIAAMQAGIKSRKVAVFVYNKQVSSKTVTNLVKLAKQHNVPVLPVTETLPKGKTYRTWLLSEYQALAKLLAADN